MIFEGALRAAFNRIGATTLLATFVSSAQSPAPASPPAQPGLVFGAQVENVFVDVFVSRRGDAVTGLHAANFELRDNGVTQACDLVDASSVPVVAILVFDVSDSVVGERLEELRTAARAFLEALRPQDEAALVTFSDEIRWAVRPTVDRRGILDAIARLRPGGGSAVIDALAAAIAVPRGPARTLVLILTDGDDNLSWLDWDQARALAERSNALVHAVTLRPRSVYASPDVDEASFEPEYAWALRQVAETTGGKHWRADSPKTLREAFASIADQMGKRYILKYEPRRVARAGWHRIEVKLRGARGDIRARRGYWIGAPAAAGSEPPR